MFLTDGLGYSVCDEVFRNFHRNVVFVDAVTKKEFSVMKIAGKKCFDWSLSKIQFICFSKMVQEVTGTNLIGFFATRTLPTDVIEVTDEIKSTFRKDKFIEVEMGFSPYYFVSNKAIEIGDDSLKVVENDKKSLLKAFKNNRNRKTVNRLFLNKFVEKIS
jgi:hypothetical protein